MFKYTNAFTNRSGDSLPGYFAKLYNSGGNLVSIYADANQTPISTVSGVANAALSDENGMFRWYVANGTYDIRFYDANDVFVSVETGVPMIEASGVYTDLSADTGAGLVGSTGSITVQASLDARPTSATLAASGGAALVGRGSTNVGAILSVTPQEYGAVADGVANDTTAIQAAINSGAKEIFFPKGNYLHGNLTCNNDYQRFVGPGARLVRNANSTTITVSARGNQFQGIRFSGGSFTGNNLTITGPEATFQNCDSIETQGRALYADSDGGNLLINGGVWATTDVSGSGYDIELKHTGASSSLYSKLIGISTNQSTGGVLIDGQGTVRLIGCQIGKFTVSGGGGFYVANRFNGAVSVQSAGNYFSANAFAGNVTFGDGAGANIGNIVFDASNGMQSGTTFTISSDVVESAFFLNQLIGVTLTLNGPNNDIWHGEISYTPVLSAGGGSPTVGNGTLSGKYSRQGKQWTANASLSFGSTSSFGTGDVAITAPFKAKTKAVGQVRVTDAGVGHFTGVCEIAASAQTVTFYAGAGSTAVGTPVRATVPMTWADGDSMTFSISGEYVA